MNGVECLAFNRSPFVNGFSNDIHDSAESAWSYWNSDRTSCVNHCLASDQTISLV